jgi:hypothetical protein
MPPELEDILNTMDIPEARWTDWAWLNRNLRINNATHPLIDQAVSGVKRMIRLEAQARKDT